MRRDFDEQTGAIYMTYWTVLVLQMLVLTIAAGNFAANALAQSPRDQLKQMVEQLQKSPNDNALREKIIKLAQEMKPVPAVPEEAERFEDRGQFAFKSAKLSTDFLDAAKEYEKALVVAPWVPGYYSDLCTIYEKAGKLAEGKRNCEFFLMSAPPAHEARDARRRIAGIEFAIEKQSAAVEQEKALQAKDYIEFGWLSGKWRLRQDYGQGNYLEGSVTAARSGNQVVFTVTSAMEYMTFWKGAGQAQKVGGPAGSQILRASLGSVGAIEWESRDVAFACSPSASTGKWGPAQVALADSKRQVIRFNARAFWYNICDRAEAASYTLTKSS